MDATGRYFFCSVYFVFRIRWKLRVLMCLWLQILMHDTVLFEIVIYNIGESSIFVIFIVLSDRYKSTHRGHLRNVKNSTFQCILYYGAGIYISGTKK